jgi:hypothetical protein
MFFVENKRAGGNWFKSFDTVDSDKSRIKGQWPVCAGHVGAPSRVREQSFSLVQGL